MDSSPDPKEIIELLDARCPATYTWSYASSRADLRALYEKAKNEFWDGRTYLPWDTDVDPTRELTPDRTIPIHGTSLWSKLAPRDVGELRRHLQAWRLSNFMHGEQGALLATAQIVSTVPWVDAKLYAATQVLDEARHVEVYERYLREKIELTYDINPNLRILLDQILTDPRWDMKYLGMQILVEGLALAAFKFLNAMTTEPLIKELTRMVMRDEARHVAFGVLSLRNYYLNEISEVERREREEFTFEACRLMRDRLLAREVWQNFGLPVDECCEIALHSKTMAEFRRLLFMRIVPNVKRLGLLTPFLRRGFEELGIIEFENMDPDA